MRFTKTWEALRASPFSRDYLGEHEKMKNTDKEPWWCNVPRLWQRDIGSAMRMRWDSGRIGHGREETELFQGEPLEEMYEELIDALNYFQEFRRQYGEHQEWHKNLQESLTIVTQQIQNQLLNRDEAARDQRVGFEPYQSEEAPNPGDYYTYAQSSTQPSYLAGPGPSTQPNQSIYDELLKLHGVCHNQQMSVRHLLEQTLTLLLIAYEPGDED